MIDTPVPSKAPCLLSSIMNEHLFSHPTLNIGTITKLINSLTMPLFTRSPRAAASNDTASPSTSTNPPLTSTTPTTNEKPPRHPYHSTHHLSNRPTFGQWLKQLWPDLLTMLIMGALGLGIYHAPPAPSRSFPVYFQDGEVVYPQFAYPLRKEIVPIWAAALLAALVPIAVVLLMQVRVRSFWDVSNAVVGLLYSLISAAVFQVVLKWYVSILPFLLLIFSLADFLLLQPGSSVACAHTSSPSALPPSHNPTWKQPSRA